LAAGQAPRPAPPARPAAARAAAQPTTVDLAPASPHTGAAVAGAMTLDQVAAGPPGAAGTTVLLVDPSRSQAVIIRGYLQRLGSEDVRTAPSGEKALEAARTAPPRVVISALHLADMTGVQLAQRMRDDPQLSPSGFIVITSQADAREADLLGPAGSAVRLT